MKSNSSADDLTSTVGRLAEALAQVRMETGADTIELRGRFRTVETRLATIERHQARILELLEAYAHLIEPRDVKRVFTPEELERVRRQKRQERAARELLDSKQGGSSDAKREEPKPDRAPPREDTGNKSATAPNAAGSGRAKSRRSQSASRPATKRPGAGKARTGARGSSRKPS